MTIRVVAHIILSLVVGGIFIACCSLAAEMLGAEVGGVIAGLPSTVVVTLCFVALTQSPARAVEETTFIPAALGLNCLFFATFALCASWGVAFALASALAIWLLLAVFAVLFVPQDLAASLLILACCFLGASLLLNAVVHPEVAANGRFRLSVMQVLIRAAFGGLVVGLGVWLSHTGGSLLGGVAAVFPAAGVSTLAITSWSRGVRFAASLTEPMMVSGACTILVYALAVRYSYLSIGVVGGTTAAIVASGGCAYVLYKWRRRRRVSAR
jgi:uncharacterized membrane protein (GlpM family)